MKRRAFVSLAGWAPVALVISPVLGVGCGDGDGGGDEEEVKSEVQAAQAWMGLDGIVEQSIDLGFKGMNATNGANIPPQSAPGRSTGTLTVVGKVDQGTSSNKNMDLTTAMAMFSNDAMVTYVTAMDPAMHPKLTLSLKKLPDGTLSGTFIGSFDMSGALKGSVKLNLMLNGQMQPDPADATKVMRKPGTTRIVGTAESMYGVFKVDITR